MRDDIFIAIFDNPTHHAYLVFTDQTPTVAMENPSVSVTTFRTLTIEDARRIAQVGLQNTDKGKRRKLAFVCDSMTLSAQHALLKICEEPAQDVVFYFVLPHSAQVLSTLRSRCVVMTHRDGAAPDSAVTDYVSMSPKDRIAFTDALWNNRIQNEADGVLPVGTDAGSRKREIGAFLNGLETYIQQEGGCSENKLALLRAVFQARKCLNSPVMTRHALHLLAFA